MKFLAMVTVVIFAALAYSGCWSSCGGHCPWHGGYAQIASDPWSVAPLASSHVALFSTHIRESHLGPPYESGLDLTQYFDYLRS